MENNIVFISYSRANSDFLKGLVNDLRNNGIDLWIDKTNLNGGDMWDNEVEAAINLSSTIIVILSPESVKSRHVMDEVSLALDKMKKVIPITKTQCEVPLRLRRLHRIDFEENYNEGLKDLIRSINSSQSNSVKSHSPAIENKTIPSAETVEEKESNLGKYIIILIAALMAIFFFIKSFDENQIQHNKPVETKLKDKLNNQPNR